MRLTRVFDEHGACGAFTGIGSVRRACRYASDRSTLGHHVVVSQYRRGCLHIIAEYPPPRR